MKQYIPPFGGNLSSTYNALPPYAPAWLAKLWNDGMPGLPLGDSHAGILHRILTTGELPARCACGECMTGGAPPSLIEYLRNEAFCGDGFRHQVFTVVLAAIAARATRSHHIATLTGINAHAGPGDYLPAMTDEGLAVAIAGECIRGAGLHPADLYGALAFSFARPVPAVLAERVAPITDGRAPWQGSHDEWELGQ